MATAEGRAWHKKMQAAKRKKNAAKKSTAKKSTAKKSTAKKTAKRATAKKTAKKTASTAARLDRVESRVSKVETKVATHDRQIHALAGAQIVTLRALESGGLITGRASLPSHASGSMH